VTRRLAWLVVGIGVILHAVAGAADLTVESLTAHEWRAFSDVFPALPSDGYPVRFHSQGTVDTPNLARVAQWTLNGGGELELQEKDGEAVWSFHWYPARNLLVSCPRSPQSPVPPLVLALPGATLASVEDGLGALGLRRCGPGASR
jgi:hypothetical protein